MTGNHASFTPSSMRAYAHAKLNLVLRILNREQSGYHSIETLFQALELADVVDIELTQSERLLTCEGPALPANGLGNVDDNLATRAAVAYTTATRWETGWSINIEKNIPVGGGLGGGSSNAAAVLRILEALSPQPIGMHALMELAGTLGADVPFLLSGAARAWGWNRGDRLLTLSALPRMEVRLISFSEGINTGTAYAAFDARRDELTRERHAAFQYPADAFSSWSSIVGLAGNDFESVVPAMHSGVARWLPVVRQAASRLVENGTPAIGMMSGSGATCYLLSAPGKLPELGAGNGMTVVNTHTLTTIASL